MRSWDIFNYACVSELLETFGIIFFYGAWVSVSQEILTQLAKHNPFHPQTTKEHEVVRDGVEPHHDQLVVPIFQLVDGDTEISCGGVSAKSSPATSNALFRIVNLFKRSIVIVCIISWDQHDTSDNKRPKRHLEAKAQESDYGVTVQPNASK